MSFKIIHFFIVLLLPVELDYNSILTAILATNWSLSSEGTSRRHTVLTVWHFVRLPKFKFQRLVCIKFGDASTERNCLYVTNI
jgi:hypothetical protein